MRFSVAARRPPRVFGADAAGALRGTPVRPPSSSRSLTRCSHASRRASCRRRCASTGPARPWPSASSTRCGRATPPPLPPPARTATSPSCGCPGGHAAAYHADSLGIDIVWALDDPVVGTHDRFRAEGERLAGALARARRRRARGGGARRVLPGRLQRQRARAREADRHRAAARPRRGTARRLDRGRRRRGRPRRAARRLRRARVRVGRRDRRRGRRGGRGRHRSTTSSAPSSPRTASSSRRTLDERDARPRPPARAATPAHAL